MKSRRLDGRGHWRRGRRRHPDPGGLLVRLRRVFRHREAGRVSLRVAAGYIGVAPRTVARWLKGEDYPSPAYQAALAAWVEALQEG